MKSKAPVLFEIVLGDNFHNLPLPIRRMHQFNSPGKAEGYASVKRGSNPISKLLAKLLRLPVASKKVNVLCEPIEVVCDRDALFASG